MQAFGKSNFHKSGVRKWETGGLPSQVYRNSENKPEPRAPTFVWPKTLRGASSVSEGPREVSTLHLGWLTPGIP